MPCTIKIKIISGKDFPIMDSKSKLADSFVTIKFGSAISNNNYSKQFETSVCKKSLNPVWNEDFRLEVADDILLQDEMVELKVFDKDYYSADDPIGVVLIDLSCLLMENSPGKISGYFPIYDTIHGIRGQLRVSLKLQFFNDFNPFKDSSAGLQFFSVSNLDPTQYEIINIHGFVEELLLVDDPEHHWIDSFRASRVSNEARQLLFNQLTGKIRRNVGKKCMELGGNAVLGFRQTMDLEGESGLIARGSGTAVSIRRINNNNEINNLPSSHSLISQSTTNIPTENKNSTVPTVSKDLSSTLSRHAYRREIHLITMNSFPNTIQICMGGIVAARAVKLLDSRTALQRSRDKW